MRQFRVIGVTLLTAAAVAVSAAAQVPPAGSGARMPPDSGGQPPTTAQPGRPPGPGEPRKPGQEKVDKNKPPEKFGPISLLPLQHYYFAGLGGSTPASDPFIEGDRIIMAMKSKTIGAWAVETGAPIWSTPDIGAVQAITVDSGRVYATFEAEVGAFETATGKALWRLPSGGAVTAPPVARAGWLIIALDSGELHALRGETGELVWKAKFAAPIKTRPVIVGDRLYVAPQNKQLIALDLVSGQKLWDQDFDSPVSAIAAQGERVFAGTTRQFFAFDHAGHLKWDRRVGAEVVGQPVVDEQTVYVVFTDNTLMAFGASRGDLRWRTALAYRPSSGPERADDTLLLTGTALVVHGYSVKDGKAGPDFSVPADPRLFFLGVRFAHGPTFFQDTVIAFFAHGWIAASRRIGPSFYSPFIDLGVVCPPLAMPGEAPPPATAAAPAPPKP